MPLAETKTTNIDTINDSPDEDDKYLMREYNEDLQAHDSAIEDYDAFEAMHMGKTYDRTSRTTSNGLTDSATATIYLERAARVAGKLPDGEMQAFGKKDYGKALFMDILRTKWIYPNANAQRPFKTKMYMWQYGSSEYGWMPMYVDLNVSPSGYFGPDCWLWNPRNFIPQNGFITVEEMDYCHAIAYKGSSWFEELEDEDESAGWNVDVIKSFREQLKNNSKTPDASRDTLLVKTKHMQASRQTMVVTRYEAGKDGRWITFLPEFGGKVIRSIKNPHKNGRIPFVIKSCIPTFDSFYGIGDFQRSMPMQFANDGLDNFYFQGIKINLFPPTIVNAQGVVRHTIKPGEAGTVWEEIIPNSVRRLETSTAGLSTYQAAKGMAKGAIQSIAGTTDTRANAESAMDPGMGKTPQALSMIGEREDTRDGQDRDLLEEAMAQLIDIMMSLILVIPNKIPVDLFSDEVEEIIADGHDDLADIFKVTTATGLLKYRMSNSKNQIRLTLDPTKLRGLEYRFQLESGSTAKKTKEQQLKGLLDFLDFIGKMPNALQEYREATGKVLDWEYIFKQYGHSADLKNMEKMFTMAPVPPAAPAAPTADTGAPADDADMMAAEQALGGGQPAPAPAMPVTMPAPMPMPAPVAPQIQHPAIQQAMMRADALMAQ
jgi:hypothetical protein